MKITDFIEQLFQSSSSPLKQINLVGSALSFQESRIDENGDEYFVTASRGLGAFDDGKLCLALMITECRDLEILRLENQTLYSRYGEYLNAIAFIVRNNPKLRVLNLERNWFRWDENGLNFFQCLKTTSSLEELNLKKCIVNDQALDSLGEVLKNNKSLRKLYIGKKHSFGLDALDRFVTVLNGNTSLVECEIDISIMNNFNRLLHFSRFNAIKKRLDVILARNKRQQYNNISPSHAVSSTSSSSSTSSTATTTQTSSAAESKNSYSELHGYFNKANTNDVVPDDALIWARLVIRSQLDKTNPLLEPYRAQLRLWTLQDARESVATTSTQSQSQVISDVQYAVSTTTLMPPDTVRQLLKNTVAVWVDLLVKRDYPKAAVTLVITATLRALRDNKWERVLEGHASGEIPEKIVPFLNKFIQKNPILKKACEHPRTISRICENLLESLSDSTESTVEESSSLSK